MEQNSHYEPKSYLQLIPAGKGKSTFFSGVSLNISITIQESIMSRNSCPTQRDCVFVFMGFYFVGFFLGGGIFCFMGLVLIYCCCFREKEHTVGWVQT